MADSVPTGRPAPWRFDRMACQADLDAFADLLAAQAELSERDDILPFFHEHPHLAALLGSFNPNAVSYDRLGFEVGLFGQFVADVVVGDAESRAYCLVEFEDGRRNSIFAQRGRQTPEWASRFEHALGQIIAWLWLLGDQEQTLAFEERFGPRPVAVTALLVAGRDSGVSALGRRRLAWRERHILVNSQHIYYLLQHLRRPPAHLAPPTHGQPGPVAAAPINAVTVAPGPGGLVPCTGPAPAVAPPQPERQQVPGATRSHPRSTIARA